MDTYSDYLLDEVIGERKIITYRQLSRALKVNVNVAKEMLYDFYTTQNSKNPNTVHATYLLTGFREEKVEDDAGEDASGEDIQMEASPFDATQQSDKTLVRCVVVVAEEKLAESKAEFSQLSSIHIYSLQPTKPADLHIVAAAAQEVLEGVDGENAREMAQVYGTISNPEAKPRTQRTVLLQTPSKAPRRVTAVTATAADTKPEATKPEVKKSNPLASAFAKKPEAKEKAVKKEKPAEEKKAAPEPEKAIESAATKKTQKAFFSSWNAASQKAKEKKENSQASTATQSLPAESEDEKMESDSESEEPEEPAPPARDLEEDIRKRKAKRDAIEAMMDMSDEEKPPSAKKKTTASPVSPPTKSESPEPPPLSGQPGRKRARRKVTKKVTTKDDEGYLVVKLESVWESYSEDEPDPPKPKPKPKATPAAAPAKKGKKPVGQQGTLTSFFQKK